MSYPLLVFGYEPKQALAANESLDIMHSVRLRPKMPTFDDMISQRSSKEHQARILSDKIHRYYDALANGLDTSFVFANESPKHSDKISDPLGAYLQQHVQWAPHYSGQPSMESNPTHNTYAFNRGDDHEDRFVTYVHHCDHIGEKPLPPLYHHASCTTTDTVYTIGGITSIFENAYPRNLDLSDFIIKEQAILPPPLKMSILNSTAMIPNRQIYCLSSCTGAVKAFQPKGDVPPPLMAMSCSLLTSRYIFCYGGFELITKVEKTPEGKYLLWKSIKINHAAYILDTETFRFQKCELTAQPNPLVLTPITIPRFGHSQISVNIEKHCDVERAAFQNMNTYPATICVMGGFRMSSENPVEYEAIEDFWKLEVSVNYSGKHDYIQFGSTVLATPIPKLGKFPPPRAFHIAEILDSKVIFGTDVNSIISSVTTGRAVDESVKLGMTKRTPLSLYPIDDENTTADKLSNLKMIIHGGNDGRTVFGDVWWFDFDEERWYEIETKFNTYNNLDFKLTPNEFQRVILMKTGHHSFLFDKFLVTIGGVIPSDFTLNRQRSKYKDISEAFVGLEDKQDRWNRLNYKMFILNLTTQTWFVYKAFHGFNVDDVTTDKETGTIPYRFSLIGNTASLANSRVFIIGGIVAPNLTMVKDVPRDTLNNSVAVIDFPLGGLSSEEHLKQMKFFKS